MEAHVARRRRALITDALRRHARPLTAGAVLLLATNALALAVPYLLKLAIEAMHDGTTARTIAGYGAAIVVVAIVQAGVRTLSRLAILNTSREVAYETRQLLFRHLLRLGSRFYGRIPTGDLMSRAVNDMMAVRSLFGPSILNVVNTAVLYVSAITLMALLDWRLTLVALVPYPVLLGAITLLTRRIYARSARLQRALAELSATVQENVASVQLVKAYAQEERQIAGFTEACGQFRRDHLALARARGALVPVMMGFGGVGTLMVLWLGSRHVVSGIITLGDFVAFNAYLALLATPTIAMGWIINAIQRGLSALERIAEVLETEPELADSPDAAPLTEIRDRIEIRDLEVTDGDGDDGRDRPRLRLSLDLPAGSSLGVIGTVGSGKTTLAEVLARVRPVPDGTVFVDGVDVNRISVAGYRERVGYVPQEAFLFSRTLRENVALGSGESVDETAVRAALDAAGLGRDLERFPDGVETRIGERGHTLSGGQRQRVALARTLVGRPDLLILDDALSHVDSDTEARILEYLSARVRRQTSVVISNRVRVVSGADRIVVLDQGEVIEQGTHEELLLADGLYARIHRLQQIETEVEDFG